MGSPRQNTVFGILYTVFRSEFGILISMLNSVRNFENQTYFFLLRLGEVKENRRRSLSTSFDFNGCNFQVIESTNQIMGGL
jgi:hypothetical protein